MKPRTMGTYEFVMHNPSRYPAVCCLRLGIQGKGANCHYLQQRDSMGFSRAVVKAKSLEHTDFELVGSCTWAVEFG